MPFVSNYLYRAELEEDKKIKSDLLSKGYENIRRIITMEDYETVLNEEYYFNINNYIDSEIKSVDLTYIQVMSLFKDRDIGIEVYESKA